MAPGAEELLSGRRAPEEGGGDRPSRRRTLVVGLGNPILSDDAVGVRLARDIVRRTADEGRQEGVHVVAECAVGGLGLLDIVTGFERVIILDAIRTIDGEPGVWYRFTAADLRETLNLRNVHDTNLATALELGRRLGMDVPPDSEIHIIAVEALDVATFSEDMTPELEAAYPSVLREVLFEVDRLIAEG